MCLRSSRIPGHQTGGNAAPRLPNIRQRKLHARTRCGLQPAEGVRSSHRRFGAQNDNCVAQRFDSRTDDAVFDANQTEYAEIHRLRYVRNRWHFALWGADNDNAIFHRGSGF